MSCIERGFGGVESAQLYVLGRGGAQLVLEQTGQMPGTDVGAFGEPGDGVVVIRGPRMLGENCD